MWELLCDTSGKLTKKKSIDIMCNGPNDKHKVYQFFKKWIETRHEQYKPTVGTNQRRFNELSKWGWLITEIIRWQLWLLVSSRWNDPSCDVSHSASLGSRPESRLQGNFGRFQNFSSSFLLAVKIGKMTSGSFSHMRKAGWVQAAFHSSLIFWILARSDMHFLKNKT